MINKNLPRQFIAALLLVFSTGILPVWAMDFNDAENFIKAGEFAKARQLLSQMESSVSQSERPWYEYLRSRVEENPVKVEELLNEVAFEYGPSEWRDDALFDLGQLYLITARPQKAADVFDKLVNNYQDSPYAGASAYWLGTALTQAGQYQEAREAYQFLLKKTPKGGFSAAARSGIADAYYKEEKFESALEAYRTVLVIHPQSDLEPWIYLQAARSLDHLKRKTESDKFYEYLLRTYPRSPEAQFAKRERPSIASSVQPDPSIPAPGTPEKVSGLSKPNRTSPSIVIPKPTPKTSVGDSTSYVSPQTKVQETGDYTVQFGSFSQRSRANLLMNQMADKGITCEIKKVGSSYKVWSGRYQTLEQAQKRVDELKKKGIVAFATRIP